MSSYKLKLPVVFLLTFALISCTQNAARKNTIVIAESKSYEASLFRQNCAICHGAEANGKQMNDKYIPSLRYGSAANRTEQEIYHQIKEGKMPMPSFKNQLSEEDIKKMVIFIRRDLQGKEVTAE